MRKMPFIFICLISVATLIFPDTSPENLALVHGTLIDGTGNKPVADGTVLIREGKIEAIGRNLPVPEGFTVIDLTGKTLLPGFINAHVHEAYEEEHLRQWLKAGVTTVRDLGANPDGSYLAVREELAADPLNARIISATPVLCPPDGYGYYTVASPDEGAAAVNRFLDMGCDLVKISLEDDLDLRAYPIFELETLQAMTEAAHSRGFQVTAHLTHARNLDLAVQGGVDEIAHMVVEPLSRRKLEMMINADVFWIPTLELWDNIQSMYPVDFRNIAVSNLRRFYRAGGKIVLGTDSNGLSASFDQGFPIREVRLMESAGMDVMDIITAGTRNGAIVCGREDSLGSLEPGKIADILILNSDPLENTDAFLDVHMVLKEGYIVSSDQ